MDALYDLAVTLMCRGIYPEEWKHAYNEPCMETFMGTAFIVAQKLELASLSVHRRMAKQTFTQWDTIQQQKMVM